MSVRLVFTKTQQGSFHIHFGVSGKCHPPWLTDKSRPLYFSSRFLVRKHKSRLATFGILLL